MGDSKYKEEGTETALRISWIVPLPWLIGGALGLAINAAALYYGQLRQGEIQVEQKEVLKDMAVQMRELRSLISTTNSKDFQHDTKLEEHERRIQALESKVK
jgi:hypothetical protein